MSVDNPYESPRTDGTETQSTDIKPRHSSVLLFSATVFVASVFLIAILPPGDPNQPRPSATLDYFGMLLFVGAIFTAISTLFYLLIGLADRRGPIRTVSSRVAAGVVYATGYMIGYWIVGTNGPSILAAIGAAIAAVAIDQFVAQHSHSVPRRTT